MSMINRLCIKGIRSFGEDQQKIEFTTPLTLIVGENGCGKTTIIECLKYALTGDVPPGSDRGRNFVHDVKLLTKNVSDGRVELTITDPDGDDKTVFRSMRLENVKGKPKFTTFDSTIKYSSKDDQFSSGRVEDVNNHMCKSMGVSKAILNNVIFCHQEDSNWPLDEGKKLKEKFDAIFGTTEYNNAIAKITKIRKTYDDEWKQCKANSKFLEEIKLQVERKERSIVDLENKIGDVKKKYEEFEKNLAPLEVKKEQMLKKEADYSVILAEENTYKITINNKNEERRKLEQKIKKKLKGTIEDLEKELKDFIDNQQQKKDQLKNMEAQYQKLLKEERGIQASLQDTKNKAANCIEKLSKLQDLKSDRFEKAKEICGSLGIDFDYDVDQMADTQDIRGIVKNIKDEISKMEKKLQAMKSKMAEDDAAYQKQIDELRVEKTKIETNLVSQRQSLSKFDGNILKIQNELKESEQSIPMLNKLKPEIEKYEKELKKLQDESNVDEMRESQDIINADIVDFEENLAQLENDIDILQSASKITGELELKESDLAKDQKEFDRLKNKLSSGFKNLFSKQSIESNFRSKVQSKREELEQEVKATQERITSLQRENDKTLIQRNNLRDQLKKKEQDVRKIEQEIEDVCNGREYPDFLASQKEKVEKLNLELAVKESSKNTYKSFIGQIDDEPCCPLCHKNLDNDESDKLKVELEESINELPSKISKIRENLRKETILYDKVNGLKSSYDSLEKLHKEISQIKSDSKKLDVKFNEQNEEKENLETVLAEPESLKNIITPSFFADVCKLDDLQRNITAKTKNVTELKSKLPSNIPQKSLSEAQAERKSFADKIKANNDRIKELNDQINKYQNKLMDTREKLNNLNTKKNDFQKKVQGIEVLKEQCKQIKKDKENLEAEIKKNESKLQPTIQKFTSMTQEKEKSHKNHQNKIDKEQKLMDTLKLEQGDLDRLDKDIADYEMMDLENSVKKFETEMEKLKETEISVKDNLDIAALEVEELKSVLANEETTQRNIVDNIDLLKLEEKKKEAENKLEELRQQMGELDYEKMKAEKKDILTKLHKISLDRTKLMGQEGELNNQMESIKTELNDKKYKNAKENYINELSREAILAAASSDLKKYSAALEKSLLKYHQEKMDQINEILKELWNSIYQGNDIDYIMIKTDEEEGSTSASEKSRRSYSYRVVRIKNDTEIDMRGRCSAGQKVLASLIIRIALADTFSSSCGILALDEPTTNLDSNNVSSLSNALAQLVAERDNGRFMLIVITHDENFVRSLERAEKYWKLSRNQNGCSVIEEFSNY